MDATAKIKFPAYPTHWTLRYTRNKTSRSD